MNGQNAVRKYLFADESGDMAFKAGPNISRYFILCSVHLDPDTVGPELLKLRREMAWEGLRCEDCVHATSDPQVVRDKVFALLRTLNFRVDATMLDKRKALPTIRSRISLYKYAWYYHFKHIGPRIFNAPNDEAHIAAASLGTKREKAAFNSVINDVAQQVIPHLQWRTSFWPAPTDPCLVVADYCAWAIQAKWERGELRPHALISSKIVTEYDLFRNGTTLYY